MGGDRGEGGAGDRGAGDHGAGAGGARLPALLPQPRALAAAGGPPLRARTVALGAVPAPLAGLRAAVAGTLAPLAGPAGGVDVTLTVGALDGAPPQAYHLAVDDGGVHVAASDARGVLYAARTLTALWTATGGVLPQVRVRDHPTFAVRGVFAESTRGPDLMTLRDWCAFVDQLAALRITHLGVALYGCWDLRHDADRSEFLFVPLDDHPDLHTQRRLRTWDPELEAEVVRQVTPAMFAGDFFGQVVAHARSRGVDIVPAFAGPGHSSLLPRVYPEMSARDASGVATGYGYCVTRPAALGRLRAVVTSLIAQHLRPAGITTMGAGGDEYYPIRNLDADDPLREISPWCRCPTCRQLTPGQQLLAYYRLIGPLLADAGIRMQVWHDSLVELGVLTDFADWARAALPQTPVVSWWGYSDPLPAPATGTPPTGAAGHPATDPRPGTGMRTGTGTPPGSRPRSGSGSGSGDAAGLETWVSPTTGLIPCLALEDHSLNIESWLRAGVRAGATGVYAYNTPDPAYHKNYACLADLSWNLEGSGGAAGFKRRWCEIVCPDDAEEAVLAYAVGEQILGDHAAVTFLLDHLLAYFSTAPWGVVRFPDDVLRVLTEPSPALGPLLQRWSASLRRAGRELPPTRALPPWPDAGAAWRAETERLADHIDLVLALVAAVRGPADQRDERAAELTAQGLAMLRRVATTRVPYQAPYVLREHWSLVAAIPDLLSGDRAVITAAPAPWQAWRF